MALPGVSYAIHTVRDEDLITEARKGNLAYFFGLELAYYRARESCQNVRDNSGCTLLHIAASMGRLNLVHWFLCQGLFEVDIASLQDGETPLFKAVLSAPHDRLDPMVCFLVHRGANVNVPSLIGRTCLGLAIQSGKESLAKWLLLKGADPNALDMGQTPLGIAARLGRERLILPLIFAGSNADAVCQDGLKPIQHAAMAHNDALVRLLAHFTQPIQGFNF